MTPEGLLVVIRFRESTGASQVMQDVANGTLRGLASSSDARAARSTTGSAPTPARHWTRRHRPVSTRRGKQLTSRAIRYSPESAPPHSNLYI